MKQCTKCGETKPKFEFGKQSSLKDGLACYCKICKAHQKHLYYLKNKEALAEKTKKYRQENKEKSRAYSKKWIESNPEKYKISSIKKTEKYRSKQENKIKCVTYSKEWALKNPEKRKSQKKRYYEKNKHNESYKVLTKAVLSKRRAYKINAFPSWADNEKIKVEYALATWCSKVMGEKYHVDHIVPLQSKKVCGLHVHANLQVLPAIENIKKGNRVWPDMW